MYLLGLSLLVISAVFEVQGTCISLYAPCKRGEGRCCGSPVFVICQPNPSPPQNQTLCMPKNVYNGFSSILHRHARSLEKELQEPESIPQIEEHKMKNLIRKKRFFTDSITKAMDDVKNQMDDVKNELDAKLGEAGLPTASSGTKGIIKQAKETFDKGFDWVKGLIKKL